MRDIYPYKNDMMIPKLQKIAMHKYDTNCHIVATKTDNK